MKAYFEKAGGNLRPWDERALEFLRKLPQGKVVEVEIKRARNPQHHRKFFALLNLVWSNQERYPSVDCLLAALKISIGHVDMITMPGGKTHLIPRSINFASMNQDEFDDFYKRCLDKIMEHFLPGVTEPELEAELMEFAA